MTACVSLTAAPVDAITFHAEPGQLFLPVDEVVRELRWTVERDEKCRVVRLNDVVIPAGTLRSLTDGTELLSTADLQPLGVEVAIYSVEVEPLVGGRSAQVCTESTDKLVNCRALVDLDCDISGFSARYVRLEPDFHRRDTSDCLLAALAPNSVGPLAVGARST